jgi:hypothetical protein
MRMGLRSLFLIAVDQKNIFFSNHHFVVILKAEPETELPEIGNVFFLSFGHSLASDQSKKVF